MSQQGQVWFLMTQNQLFLQNFNWFLPRFCLFKQISIQDFYHELIAFVATCLVACVYFICLSFGPTQVHSADLGRSPNQRVLSVWGEGRPGRAQSSQGRAEKSSLSGTVQVLVLFSESQLLSHQLGLSLFSTGQNGFYKNHLKKFIFDKKCDFLPSN